MRAYLTPWLGWARRGGWASLALVPELHMGWGTTGDSVAGTVQWFVWVRIGWLPFHLEGHFEGDLNRDFDEWVRGRLRRPGPVD